MAMAVTNIKSCVYLFGLIPNSKKTLQKRESERFSLQLFCFFLTTARVVVSRHFLVRSLTLANWQVNKSNVRVRNRTKAIADAILFLVIFFVA